MLFLSLSRLADVLVDDTIISWKTLLQITYYRALRHIYNSSVSSRYWNILFQHMLFDNSTFAELFIFKYHLPILSTLTFNLIYTECWILYLVRTVLSRTNFINTPFDYA